MRIANKIIYNIAFVLAITTLYNCGGGGGGGEEIPEDPKPATLIFPLQNSECNEGTIISETESRVTFEWNEAVDANSYTLVLTNLLENTTRNINTVGTSKSETILRGVPYSWYIVSKANGTPNTANSETWKFYNAGIAVENYAPFPAGLLSPVMGGLATTSTTLKWEGSDIDNDIQSYDVYLSTTSPPTTLLGNTVSPSFDTSSLTPDTVYYWSVTTKDGHGNQSLSPIFEFRTQQ